MLASSSRECFAAAAAAVLEKLTNLFTTAIIYNTQLYCNIFAAEQLNLCVFFMFMYACMLKFNMYVSCVFDFIVLLPTAVIKNIIILYYNILLYYIIAK